MGEIVDLQGNEVISEDDRWLAGALFCWLSDTRVRIALELAGENNKAMGTLWLNLKNHLQNDIPYTPGPLREAALRILSHDQVRGEVARVVGLSQEAQLDEWAKDMDEWLRTPEKEEPGPKPERPPKQSDEQIMIELGKLKFDLEARVKRAQSPLILQ